MHFVESRVSLTMFTGVCHVSHPQPDESSLSSFFKIHFNITPMSMPTFSQWSLCFRFPNQNSVCISFLLHFCHMPCKSHLPLDHAGNIWRGVQITKLPLCIFLQSFVTFSLLGPNSFLIILLCNTLSLYSFLNVSDHVPRLFKTGRIILLH